MSFDPTPAFTPPGPAGSLPDWPTDRPLRRWQEEALDAVLRHPGDSFLAAATPAAGKTTFGLRVAWEMLSSGAVSRVVVVGPTTHICRQWASAAARFGIELEPNRPNADGVEIDDFHGVAVTYQTVAADPAVHNRAAGRSTLVIADEPHHMGEQASWGRTARHAFDRATFRLLLSGTPFRSDSEAIPWVGYDDEGLSQADYSYGYPEAMVDRVCRPITFLPYDGEMEWVSHDQQWTADFDADLPAVESARRLRTALAADGEWMGTVLRDADRRLEEVRCAGHPDAGGLVIATDQEHARAVAGRLTRIAGEKAEVVISDEPGASERISRFSGSDRRWLVSVLMVSEGVDIPRLRVGVYATPARTELFFRQVVGRFIRSQPSPRRQMSYLLLPADPRLKQLALGIEQERRHAIELDPDREEELDEREHERPDPGEDSPFAVVGSTAVEADDAILAQTTLQLFSDDEYGPTADTVSAVTGEVIRSTTVRRPEPAGRRGRAGKRSSGEDNAAARRSPGQKKPETTYQARERLRDERRRLVADVSRRTGEGHRTVHARINRAVGAASVSKANLGQLEKGNQLLRDELT